MATARRTLVFFSVAIFSPRSRKTLPELRTTERLLLRFAITRLVILSCHPQSLTNQVHVRLSGLDSFRRLLLKSMQHINSAFESHRVNRPVRIAAMVLYYLQNSRSRALPGLRPGVLPAELGDAQSRP